MTTLELSVTNKVIDLMLTHQENKGNSSPAEWLQNSMPCQFIFTTLTHYIFSAFQRKGKPEKIGK